MVSSIFVKGIPPNNSYALKYTVYFQIQVLHNAAVYYSFSTHTHSVPNSNCLYYTSNCLTYEIFQTVSFVSIQLLECPH